MVKIGVTTTVTHMQVDAATQTKVANNTQAVTATQELQANKADVTGNGINNTIQQFKSLHDEVDNNKKQANAVSRAPWRWQVYRRYKRISMLCSLLAVQRTIMKAPLPSGHPLTLVHNVIAKVSFSDDTANNMGRQLASEWAFN